MPRRITVRSLQANRFFSGIGGAVKLVLPLRVFSKIVTRQTYRGRLNALHYPLRTVLM